MRFKIAPMCGCYESLMRLYGSMYTNFDLTCCAQRGGGRAVLAVMMEVVMVMMGYVVV